jgi:predicted TIM-barrel fold metal-dependent hydrolase
MYAKAVPWEDARRIDVHNHVWDIRRGGSGLQSGKLDVRHAERLLYKGDKLGIDYYCVSVPLMSDAPTPDEVRMANDVVLQAMDLSDRFVGFCFVNPGYAREALQEIERCIADGGMVGIKLYHQYLVCDPAQRPVMDRAAELGVPVLMHAGKVMDAVTRARQPRLSNAAHFLSAAKMFPDTTLIQAHIGGGGDWEWNLRVLETCPPNVYMDTSGSVIDRGIVDRTIATLGVDRVLFATDGSLEEGVGKLLEADLKPDEQATVFAGNARSLLARPRRG